MSFEDVKNRKERPSRSRNADQGMIIRDLFDSNHPNMPDCKTGGSRIINHLFLNGVNKLFMVKPSHVGCTAFVASCSGNICEVL